MKVMSEKEFFLFHAVVGNGIVMFIYGPAYDPMGFPQEFLDSFLLFSSKPFGVITF